MHAGAGVAAQLDRAAELGGDQRLHDREAEARSTGRSRSREAGRRRRRPRRPRARPSVRASCTVTCPWPDRRRPGKAWSTAFCMSSLSTTASGVARSPGSCRRRPRPEAQIAVRADDRLCTTRTSGWMMSSKRTTSPGSARQRLVHDGDGPDPALRLLERRRASGDCSRRPCSRSSAAMVCRLFFTRWWISRMVASLEISIRSRRRRSVTSRSSTHTPRPPARRSSSGIACTSTDVSPRSISSVTGRRARIATSTASSSKPISARWRPEV